MKHMKKFMALFAALALVLAMAVPAFADEPTTYTITVPNGSTHTYEVYQIFTGDYSKDEAGVVKLSNIKWGKNGTGTEGQAVDADTLTALSNVASNTSDRAKLTVIEQYANLTNPINTVSAGAPIQVTPGYYLFKDQVAAGAAEGIYITQVVGDVTITAKDSDVPDFKKKLKDANDTEGTITGWQDVADHDIGDDIPFKLEATIPSDYANYKTYYLAFHDVAEHGLTFNKDSVKVYVGENEITSGYRLVTSGFTDGCTFEVIFDNLKTVASVTAGSAIRVEYTASLNDTAVIGGAGNQNGAKLEYSNNPNWSGAGKPSTSETPWDNVLVFTYKVVVNKYANSVADANKLEGAEFKLEKKVKNGESESWVEVKQDAQGEDKTVFTFKGLDDGDYRLTETKTPAGYNTIAPIEFTVSANHTNDDWNDFTNRAGQLTSLTGNTATGDINFTVNSDNGGLATNVINKSGTTLPGTGGIGTTIFYVIGGGLMVAAAVLLVAKKRMENK